MGVCEFERFPESDIEIYPLIGFGYGGNFREYFYCRERDKDVLLETIKGFTDEAKKVLLRDILNHVIENNGKDTIRYLEELMNELVQPRGNCSEV